MPSSCRSPRCWPGSRTSARRSSAPQRRAGAGAAHHPVRRRGAPLQQGAAGRLLAAMSSRACSPSSVRPPRTRPSRSTRRCCRARRCMCCEPLAHDRAAALFERAPREALPALASTPTRAQRLVGLCRRRCPPPAQPASRTWCAWPAPTGRIGRGGLLESCPGRATCAATTRAATQFYDPISALHKSVRGSQPGRRAVLVLRACSTAAPIRATSPGAWCAWPCEDIGLADPRALRIALDACGDLRAPRLARGRAGAGAGGDLPGRARPSRTPATWPRRPRGPS